MPTYYDYRKVYLTPDEAQDLTVALIVAVFSAMAFSWTEPEVAFLIALSILMLAEVLSINDTLSGFSNDGLITIGSLFLVIGAIEKSHIVDYSSRLAFGMNSSKTWGIFRMYFSSFIISAFFNNIPQVAVMVPVVKDWAKLRGIASSQLLIPLSYTVLAGGMLATVGTSTNLVVQGLLSNDNRVQFNFFDPAAIGLPAGMLLIAYMMIAGPYLLPNRPDKTSAEHNRAFTQVAEVTVEENSSYCNKPVRYIFEGLGMTGENFVKIRRPKGTVSVTVKDEESTAHSNITDANSKQISATGTDSESDDSPPLKKEFSTILVDDAFELQVVSILPEALATHANTFVRWVNEIIPKVFFLPENFHHVNESYGLVNDDDFEDIAPDLETIVQPGDTLFIANSYLAVSKLVKTMPWENQGISFPGKVPIKDIPSYGHEIVELYISGANPFINKTLGDVANEFVALYECAIISAKGLEDYEDSIEALFHRKSSLNVKLTQGSTVAVLTSKHAYERLLLSKHFLNVTKVQKLEHPATYWSFFPTIAFLTIVSLVAAEEVEMTPAALSMAAFFFVGGWLRPNDIEKFVDMRLLMLMGCSLSFATAMSKTGLAQTIAQEIAVGISKPMNALFLIYIATLFITEIISNNAAAALMYPISVKLADEMGVSYRPFVMVVMQAASMAFMCPIGYPTHVMVWRPGNYNFLDFCKFGFIPNMLWMIVSCLLSPAVWPFNP